LYAYLKVSIQSAARAASSSQRGSSVTRYSDM
jgi:hypothetical protein